MGCPGVLCPPQPWGSLCFVPCHPEQVSCSLVSNLTTVRGASVDYMIHSRHVSWHPISSRSRKLLSAQRLQLHIGGPWGLLSLLVPCGCWVRVFWADRMWAWEMEVLDACTAVLPWHTPVTHANSSSVGGSNAAGPSQPSQIVPPSSCSFPAFTFLLTFQGGLCLLGALGTRAGLCLSGCWSFDVMSLMWELLIQAESCWAGPTQGTRQLSLCLVPQGICPQKPGGSQYLFGKSSL